MGEFENSSAGDALQPASSSRDLVVVEDRAEAKSAAEPQPMASRNAANIIVASATEAFGSAIFLWVLGGVAISIAGSFAGDMIPSLPPSLAGQGPAGDLRSGCFYPLHAILLASTLIVDSASFVNFLSQAPSSFSVC